MGRLLFLGVRYEGLPDVKRRTAMKYFAGLDVSMEETHICVVDRDGGMVLETKATTSPEAIAAGLAKAPGCQRIVFETGRMAPTLYHGLDALGLPVTCIESRQAYQALKSLGTHKTDRNDARGLAHLARTGFFKPVHVKSLPAHAVRALIIARKKLVGQRVTLENQIRGLAVVFGVRLPRGLSPAFAEQAISGSEGIAGRQEAETSSRAERCPREGVDDGADSEACGRSNRLTAISTKPPHTQLTPSSATEHAENGGTQRHHTTAQDPSSRPLTH